MYENVLYKIHDKNLNFLIKVHYVFMIICVKLYCDAWISCPVNKQTIYLFYIFMIKQWISMKFCISYF